MHHIDNDDFFEKSFIEPYGWYYRGSFYHHDPSEWASSKFPVVALYPFNQAGWKKTVLTSWQRETIAARWRKGSMTLGDVIDMVESLHGIKE